MILFLTYSLSLIIIITMKTILQVKLLPSDSQKDILLSTMERFNESCDYISAIAFEQGCYSKFKLQKLVYHDVKERFGLTAQIVILAVRKVVDSYKKDRKKQRAFKKHGAIIYDQRVMSFKKMNSVSLWTLNGRKLIPIVFGEYQAIRWHQRKGQADLVYRGGKFYLLVSVETEEMPPVDPGGYIGVDLGVKQIASDSTGESFTGDGVEKCRQRFTKLRAALQKCGSKSAKRHLKKISKKEANYRKDVNHCISKKLVEKAKRTKCGIALEELTHIRKRIRARKSQRAKLHGWSFFQLRAFIEYKSRLVGVQVETVNPAYTSQRCSACGHIAKSNRKSQAEFVCKSCGYVDNADHNASQNISFLAVVIRQIVGPREQRPIWATEFSLEVLTSPCL